jgi:hypothetical protein
MSWWVNSPPRFRGVGVVDMVLNLLITLAQFVSRTWRGRRFAEGTYVAAYEPETMSDGRPLVVFRVADGSLNSLVGSCNAVIVGEVGLNGTCCLELPDGTVVWPIYNPVI